MANQTVMRRVNVTADYAPLSAVPLVVSVCISCPPGNGAAVEFLGDDGSDVPWIPGQWVEFRHVDLSQIQVKGTPGDTVVILGWAGGSRD